MQALKIEKLYLKHGGFLLRDFNMELEVGQIHVITGKSGSGKSTLFRAIGGALRPEAGRILYYGKEMYEDELKIRKRMSVIYDAPNFNMELSPERLAREWKKFEPWFDREAFTSYMNRLELEMNERVKLYSVEKCRKLMLALALSRNPELLVMDDVTSGLPIGGRQKPVRPRRQEAQLLPHYRPRGQAGKPEGVQEAARHPFSLFRLRR